MAADWVKIELTLPDKPEVHRMAELLDLDPNTVAGALLRWFCWLNANVMDSEDSDPDAAVDIPLSRKGVDRVCHVDGIVDALVDAGWLINSETCLQVPKFGRHNGSSTKKRALKNLRQSRWRTGKGLWQKDLGKDTPVDGAAPTDVSTRERERVNSSVRKRPTAAEVYDQLSFPSELCEDRFADEFRQWVEVRLTLKLSKNWVRLFQGHLEALVPLARERGIEAAVECVGQSRINEWQGIFPDRFRQAFGRGPAAPTGGGVVSMDEVLAAEARR